MNKKKRTQYKTIKQDLEELKKECIVLEERVNLYTITLCDSICESICRKERSE